MSFIPSLPWTGYMLPFGNGSEYFLQGQPGVTWQVLSLINPYVDFTLPPITTTEHSSETQKETPLPPMRPTSIKTETFTNELSAPT